MRPGILFHKSLLDLMLNSIIQTFKDLILRPEAPNLRGDFQNGKKLSTISTSPPEMPSDYKNNLETISRREEKVRKKRRRSSFTS